MNTTKTAALSLVTVESLARVVAAQNVDQILFNVVSETFTANAQGETVATLALTLSDGYKRLVANQNRPMDLIEWRELAGEVYSWDDQEWPLHKYNVDKFRATHASHMFVSVANRDVWMPNDRIVRWVDVTGSEPTMGEQLIDAGLDATLYRFSRDHAEFQGSTESFVFDYTFGEGGELLIAYHFENLDYQRREAHKEYVKFVAKETGIDPLIVTDGSKADPDLAAIVALAPGETWTKILVDASPYWEEGSTVLSLRACIDRGMDGSLVGCFEILGAEWMVADKGDGLPESVSLRSTEEVAEALGCFGFMARHYARRLAADAPIKADGTTGREAAATEAGA